MTSRFLAGASLVVSIGFLGCGEARQDADRAGQRVDRGPAEVIAMPDAFRNVAHKCDGHGHRVYSLSGGSDGVGANLFVINDPTCK